MHLRPMTASMWQSACMRRLSKIAPHMLSASPLASHHSLCPRSGSVALYNTLSLRLLPKSPANRCVFFCLECAFCTNLVSFWCISSVPGCFPLQSSTVLHTNPNPPKPVGCSRPWSPILFLALPHLPFPSGPKTLAARVHAEVSGNTIGGLSFGLA